MATLLWSCSSGVVAMVMALMLGAGGVAEGKTWVVGDGQGWSPMDFAAWLNGKVFTVGDELVFPYSQGAQDVAQVSQADYENCNGKYPINHWIQGDTHVKLTTVGTQYFICTFPGHCPALRLAIDVVESTNSTAVQKNQTGADVNTVATDSAPPAPLTSNENNNPLTNNNTDHNSPPTDNNNNNNNNNNNSPPSNNNNDNNNPPTSNNGCKNEYNSPQLTNNQPSNNGCRNNSLASNVAPLLHSVYLISLSSLSVMAFIS